MKQLPLPAHPVFPSRLDSIAALPELLRSRQIGCVLVIGDAHAVDCESLLLPVLEDSQIMYAVHAAVSLSDSKEGALTRTDVDTALQAFTDKQAQAILAVGGNDAMALGQALLARLHTKGYAETFEQWRAIPLILLPAAADASAVFAETGDVFDPVRGKSRRFSLRAHTSRYVLMDDAMLALQSRESLLRTGIWTIAHAICAGMSRLLPREERQKAENALRSLTGQLIAVSDDAAVPESERFSSDLASRRALHTASLDAAEAFAVSHDAVLPALLNALTTVKQLSPDETLSLLLAPMIAQSEGTRRKALSDMAIGAGLCVADARGGAGGMGARPRVPCGVWFDPPNAVSSGYSRRRADCRAGHAAEPLRLGGHPPRHHDARCAPRGYCRAVRRAKSLLCVRHNAPRAASA